MKVLHSVKHPVNIIPNGILDLIGHTALIPLQRMQPENQNVQILVKAEWMNPGGSVKDRPAYWMLKDAIDRGYLTSDKTVLDASSGNTGIGYAWICARLGIKLKICIPNNASRDRVKILSAFGAELVLTDPLEGIDGAILRARELFKDHPDQYCYLDQYNNKVNWQCHYNTTGPEIWEQTNGLLTHFIAGLGTSGTFMGISRRLKEFNSKIKCYAVQPEAAFHGIEGWKHMETSIVPGIFDSSIADENLTIGTEKAHEFTKRLAKEEGLLVGISSGAALAAAHKIAENIEDGLLITVFPDKGDRYISERFWGN